MYRSPHHPVVVATAKVQIFKQITTVSCLAVMTRWLLLLPQRYKFSSKSQQCHLLLGLQCCCCCYRKGTNFQANHNNSTTFEIGNIVVVATAKVQIFKQITTSLHWDCNSKCCCCYRKGTNFQANHNSNHVSKSSSSCCCCYRKGTNFQANHNRCFGERF